MSPWQVAQTVENSLAVVRQLIMKPVLASYALLSPIMGWLDLVNFWMRRSITTAACTHTMTRWSSPQQLLSLHQPLQQYPCCDCCLQLVRVWGYLSSVTDFSKLALFRLVSGHWFTVIEIPQLPTEEGELVLTHLDLLPSYSHSSQLLSSLSTLPLCPAQRAAPHRHQIGVTSTKGYDFFYQG